MKIQLFISLLLVFLFSSCATIISTAKQNIQFKSNPSNASIFIDEVEVGKTPLEKTLSTNREHILEIKLDGYKTYETKLTKTLNGWFFGNILIGGIIGLIIDASTGAMYKLTPSQINAELQSGVSFKKNNTIYFAVSLTIDPNWKKIGQLEKF